MGDGLRTTNKITSVPIEGIRLSLDCQFVVVRIQVQGCWIEVMREPQDGALSCIVDPNALDRRIRAALTRAQAENYWAAE